MTTSSFIIIYSHFIFYSSFFFFNDTATTEIYTLSLHDALPISRSRSRAVSWRTSRVRTTISIRKLHPPRTQERKRKRRSEEHTSELQSRPHLVCRLLLEKKKKKKKKTSLP